MNGTPGPVPQDRQPAGVPLTSQEQAEMQARLQQQLLDQHVQAAQAQLDALVQANMNGIKELAAKGGQFNPLDMINARIDAVIDATGEAMGPQGRMWAVQCRSLFESRVAEQIGKARTEGTKLQLAAAGSFSADAIRQLAKVTGTYGG